MKHNVIHEYFKKELDGYIILVQIDKEKLQGLELIVTPDKSTQKTKRRFDAEIYDDLAHDGFKPCSPLEFNLYLKGLVK